MIRSARPAVAGRARAVGRPPAATILVPFDRLRRPSGWARDVIGLLRSNLRRRSATAAGIYLSVGFGFLGTVLGARQLGKHDFGAFSVVIVGRGLLPDAARPDRRRGAREVRLRLRDGGGLGSAAAAVPRRSRGQGRRRAARGDRARRRSRRSRTRSSALRRPRDPVPDRGAAPASVQAPRASSSAALDPPRPLRHPRRAPRVLDGPAADRDRHRCALRGHRGCRRASWWRRSLATCLLGIAGILAFRRFPHAGETPLGDASGAASWASSSSRASRPGVVSLRGSADAAPARCRHEPDRRSATSASRSRRSKGFALPVCAGAADPAHRADARLVARRVRRRPRVVFAATCAWRRRRWWSIVPPVYVFMPELVRSSLRRAVRRRSRRGAADPDRRGASGRLGLDEVASRSRSAGPGLRMVAHGVESVVLIPLVVVFGYALGRDGRGWRGARCPRWSSTSSGRCCSSDQRRSAEIEVQPTTREKRRPCEGA